MLRLLRGRSEKVFVSQRHVGWRTCSAAYCFLLHHCTMKSNKYGRSVTLRRQSGCVAAVAV
jgi:hypothetical protein